MKLNLFSILLAITASALAAPSAVDKRNPTGGFSLVAYGIASSYIDIFYSDGLAYAGDSSLWPYGSVTTDVTFIINDTQLYTTATTADVTLDPDTLFYIRPTEDEVLPVGFTGDGNDVPEDAVTDSLIFYGTYLMWETAGGGLSDSFRLKETNVSGVYQLYWDQSNLFPEGFLLPVVKSLS